MRKTFISGLLGVLSVGIMFFFGKVVIYDFLATFFRPLILFLLKRDDEYLVVILTLVFTVLIIFLVGAFTRLFSPQVILSRVLKKTGIEKSHGAFVIFSPGSYYLAAIITHTRLRRINRKLENLYVLFAPYSPFPWSGLPIIFVKESKVIPLEISYREIYNITTSLGKNTPEEIEESKNRSTG